MEAKLQKWGNSLGIRIPRNIIKSLNLKTNDILELHEEDNRIIMSKSKSKKISLKKRFEEYSGKNITGDFTWDEARGEEIW